MKITFIHALIYFLRKCFQMVVFYFVLIAPDLNRVLTARKIMAHTIRVQFGLSNLAATILFKNWEGNYIGRQAN